MKLLLCPKGYIGTRVEDVDIVIDKLPHEERGYTLVDDHVAAVLLQRGGYEEIPDSTYPRSLEQLHAKVRRQLLSPGIVSGRATAKVETLPVPVRREAIEAIRDSSVPQRQTWLQRFVARFRTRNVTHATRSEQTQRAEGRTGAAV